VLRDSFFIYRNEFCKKSARGAIPPRSSVGGGRPKEPKMAERNKRGGSSRSGGGSSRGGSSRKGGSSGGSSRSGSSSGSRGGSSRGGSKKK